MKILHLTKYLPTVPGGIEKVTSTMALAAATEDHQVQVLGFSPTTPTKLVLPPSGVDLQGIVPSFHLGTVPLSLDYLRKADQLMTSQDVVHVHLPNPMGEIAALRLLAKPAHLRPKVVPLLHAPILKWGFLGRLWEKFVQAPLLRRADRVLLASENLHQYFHDRGVSIPSERCFILPFGMAPAPEIPAPVRRPKQFHILSVSRLVPYKGLDYLISAVSQLQGDWHLTIIGSGPRERELRNHINRLELDQKITLETSADEARKHSLLAGCDLYVQPSQTPAEAFGLSIVEAFCHSKPVVVTDLPTGVAYLARRGNCGAIAPLRSVRGLTEAIQGFLSHQRNSREIGIKNKEFWRNNLTLEIYQRRYLEFLNRLQPVSSQSTADKHTAESISQTPQQKLEPRQ